LAAELAVRQIQAARRARGALRIRVSTRS
jgi:hypothetical protein